MPGGSHSYLDAGNTARAPQNLQTHLCCCVIDILPLPSSLPQLFPVWSFLAMQHFVLLPNFESLGILWNCRF